MNAASRVVVCRNVHKVYGEGSVAVEALRGVDLDVFEGERLALVGPSGSGKTTLLNLIGTLDQPSSGELTVGGQRVDRLSRAQAAKFRLHNVGFIFQAYNLLPVLTAYENAEYVLLLQGVPRARRREIVVPLLERVGLGDMLDRRPHEMSGGQQQRVAVVRAIVARPRIVLADEPTANLDSHTSEALLDLIAELNEEHGITFVFATHDPMVMRRAQRVVRLRDGLVEEAAGQAA